MSSQIEQRVMGSVAVVYTLRRLLSPVALKLYVGAACLWGIGQLVWVSKVFENFSHAGLQGFIDFVFSAVLNTDTAVQLVLAALLFVLCSLVLDFLRPVHRLA